MPIKHVLLWRFLPHISGAQKSIVMDGFQELLMHFPQMRNPTLGVNISKRDSTFTHAFAVEFESMEDLDEYLSSALHEEYVVAGWRPFVEERVIASFEGETSFVQATEGDDR